MEVVAGIFLEKSSQQQKTDICEVELRSLSLEFKSLFQAWTH